MTRHSPRRWLTPALAITLMLAGCAQELIRDRAAAHLRDGDYEAALTSYQDGVNRYPDSAALRAGLASARAEALARLIAQTAQQRALAQYDEADRTVARALTLEPRNERLMALQVDVAIERRQRQRLEQATSLAKAGKKEAALRILETGLRESPRHAELLALQRRLETDLRFERDASGRRGLAEGRPISLDFRGAPVSTVLDAITRSSGVNFILDRDVKQDGRVTVFLRSAKVEDAIDLVTSAQQLARRTIDSQTVLIYPNTPEKQREHQEQVIRVFHLGSAEAKSTAALLRAMLRIKEPFVDERANLVAIRETPEIVALAERLVSLHDVGEAEVMLEVEVMEVRSSRLTELGINFPNTVSFTPLPESGATGQTLTSLRSLNADRVGVSVAGLLLKLRREVGDFSILANPRIRTKSREKARIVIGDKVPVITATTNATGFVADTVSYLEVGLKLDVEPLVSPDDDVTIKLGLEVSSLAKEVHTTSGTLAYQIGTRNANTTLRLRDGETQLLGGLISNEDRSSANRVPGLGDLPIAGRLFSSQLDDVQRTELVLAITPRIVRSAPRPDLAQAELWVGTEMVTRLRAAPERASAASSAASLVPASGNLATHTPGAAAATGTASVGSVDAMAPAASALPKLVKVSWQAPKEVKAGETFTVNLNLASGVPLRGAPIEIAYPKEALEVIEVLEGPFFQQEGGLTSFTNAVNAQTGLIGTAVLRRDASGASGQANVLQLKLRAKTAGPVDLTITALKPIGMGGPPEIATLPVMHLIVK